MTLTVAEPFRARFEAELERMLEFGWRGLIIEATFDELVRQSGNVNPSAVVGSLVSFSTRFAVHILFAGSRRHAEALTWRLAERWVRDRAAALREGTAA